MRKWIALLFTTIMLLTMCACGRNEVSTETTIGETAEAFQVMPVGEADIYDAVYLGTYEQDNNKSNGQEHIEWVVLDKADGKLLVISRYALDNQPYHASGEDVTWETSSLRKWLNEDFYNSAFSKEEQAVILTAEVSPDKNPEYETTPGNATQDKIFVLSMSEVNQYFPAPSSQNCWPTAYAVAHGVFASKSKDPSNAGSCGWWTRTPGWYQNRAVYVMSGGVFFTSGIEGNDHNMQPAVRPAMWVSVA